MRHAILFVLWAGCAVFAETEDISMTDGKVLKNAEVIRFEADGPVIKHDGGTNHIVWNDLSPAVRRRYQAEARKQKEKEIQKLKQDLARAEAEAARLGPGVGQPEGETLAPPEPSVNSTAPSAAADAPPKPVAQLLPLKPDEIVDAAGLVQQFKSNPSGAERRYRNKVFRVKGVIERFEPKLFIRKYDVIFESPDRFVRVVAAFDYPGDYRTVFTTQRGQTLVGKPAENTEVTLLRAGQTLVLQGRCKGTRDAEIVFTGCTWVR